MDVLKKKRVKTRDGGTPNWLMCGRGHCGIPCGSPPVDPVEANDEQRTTARSNVALYCVGFPFFLFLQSIFACLLLAHRCAYASSRERDDQGCLGLPGGTGGQGLHVGETLWPGSTWKRGDRAEKIPKRLSVNKTRQTPEKLGLGRYESVHNLTTELTSLGIERAVKRSLLRLFQVIKVSYQPR